MKQVVSIFSSGASAVDLLLFKKGNRKSAAERISLSRAGDFWTAELDGLNEGSRYQIYASGEFNPQSGLFYKEDRPLLDPRATTAEWQDGELFGVFHNDSLDLAKINYPALNFQQLIIYELHVKGFTQLHPKVPKKYRGTFLGLAEEYCLDYLSELGVNAIELMPIFLKCDEPRLTESGLTNYWGYNPVSFFALDPRFVVAKHELTPNQQFKYLVKRLHERGIEIILDVVFNHTGEGKLDGLTYSFRGLDNRAYYLGGGEPYAYFDRTGCGNTVRTDHPAVTSLIVDALEYWHSDMGVDGFRFDLAPAVFSSEGRFSHESPLLQRINASEKLRTAKLIAEPWDLGSGDGYQLGHMPDRFREWNGKFRDDLRKYWRGDTGTIGALATRLAGSSDTFRFERGPSAGINFITAHDGFTLRDLYTYEQKRNLENLEDNRDGESHNFGWNCGEEGDDVHGEVLRMRRRMVRNQFASLFLSLGIPMISMGDEIGRSQLGNNNSYCHDTDWNYVNWKLDRNSKNLRQFVEDLIRFREANPVFCRTQFYCGQTDNGFDVRWLDENGEDLQQSEWENGGRRVLLMLLNDSNTRSRFLVAFNSSNEQQLIKNKFGRVELIFNTASEQPFVSKAKPIKSLLLEPRSLACYSVGDI